LVCFEQDAVTGIFEGFEDKLDAVLNLKEFRS
jgi:hypothetical protein